MGSPNPFSGLQGIGGMVGASQVQQQHEQGQLYRLLTQGLTSHTITMSGNKVFGIAQVPMASTDNRGTEERWLDARIDEMRVRL